MKEFMRQHEEWILGIFGLCLFGLVIVCAVWVVTDVSRSIAEALNAHDKDNAKIEFKLDEFQKANLRGLNNQ